MSNARKLFLETKHCGPQTGRRNKIIMFEPIVRRRVQSSMARLKMFIVSVLPLLWLVALGHCSMESPAGALPSNAAGQAARSSETSCCSPVECVRCPLPRGGGERGLAAPKCLAPVSTDDLFTLCRFTPAIPPAGEAYLLQQRWQFVWRTADAPRPPSCLV